MFLSSLTKLVLLLDCGSCSTLPDVPHAQVTQETRKSQYQAGHMIHFACEPGYTSALTIKYVCATEGWQPLHKGSCYREFNTPNYNDIHVHDDCKTFDYSCSFHRGLSPLVLTCVSQAQIQTHRLKPVSSSRCDPPPTLQGLTVKGLPENSIPIPPDHILTFSCDGPGKYLNGVSVLICGQDGQWNNPFPTCVDRSCKVGVMHPHLYVAGLPPSNEIMATGHKLRFLCSNTHVLKGSREIECLENGQWNSPFPTCSGMCDQGCGRPPPLSDGDTKTSTKRQYQHNERVEYICQNYYAMDGGPFKTCVDGEWIGEIRCLQPCVVNREDLNRHNIWFKYTTDDKLYTEHHDAIEFICARGHRHVGTLGMRQRCENGVINLPTCQ
uniref:Sushi domain-containing protein n=1 Tax=Oreochromis aureus TaxID=47969 RepID=A0A668VDS9_OREAU